MGLTAEDTRLLVHPETEDERVFCWRVEQLAEAGFSGTMLFVLAGQNDVDLHHAVSLIRNGCPADTAVRILL